MKKARKKKVLNQSTQISETQDENADNNAKIKNLPQIIKRKVCRNCGRYKSRNPSSSKVEQDDKYVESVVSEESIAIPPRSSIVQEKVSIFFTHH